MELVSSEEDIRNNLVVFDQDLAKELDTSGWYHERIQFGVNFISYKVGSEWRFAPSRYIGYKDNSMESHEGNQSKDGGKTNEKISEILKHEPESNDKKSDQFRKFANRYGISPHNRPHKFWTLQSRKVEKDHDSGTEDTHPEELPEVASLLEGATTTVCVNKFERNSQLREQCVQHWGCKCSVCDFDFSATYGEIGRGFIHVHHVVPLASIRNAHEVDPIKDLIPVCPNCHAMLHRSRGTDNPRTVDELRNLVMDAKKKR